MILFNISSYPFILPVERTKVLEVDVKDVISAIHNIICEKAPVCGGTLSNHKYKIESTFKIIGAANIDIKKKENLEPVK